MHKSKLLYLLGGLTKKEMRELEQFIDSPAFNKDNTVKPLYEQILRYFPDFESPRLKKENLANRIYGNADASTLKKLAYTTSNFIKLVRKYIIWKELDVQEDDSNFLEMKAYKRRNLDKSFFKLGERFNKRLDDLPYRDMEYFRLKYMLNGLIGGHEGQSKMEKGVRSIQLYIKNLELYFLNAKLFQFKIIFDRHKVVQENFEIHLIDEILDLTQKNNFLSHPSIQIKYYFLLHQMEILDKESSRRNYFLLKDFFLKNFEKFRKNEKEEIVILLMNYSSRLYYLGYDEFWRELFLNYQYAMESKILFIDGYLISTHLMSLVQVGGEIGEIKYVENNLKHFLTHIRKEELMIVKKICLSYIELHKKNFDNVLLILRDAKPRNFMEEWLVRILTLKVYYEAREENLLYNLAETFEAFVRRHKKLPEKKKRNSLKFIKFVITLSKNRHFKKYTYDELIVLIEDLGIVANKYWLKMKIAEQF